MLITAPHSNISFGNNKWPLLLSPGSETAPYNRQIQSVNASEQKPVLNHWQSVKNFKLTTLTVGTEAEQFMPRCLGFTCAPTSILMIYKSMKLQMAEQSK